MENLKKEGVFGGCKLLRVGR